MSTKILQVNFKFHVLRSEYEEAVSPLANDIAAVPGLIWKVWLMNEAETEAGGIYLFEDGESMQAYIEGPIVQGVISNPALSDFNIKQFDVMEELSAVTRGIERERV